MESEGRVTDLNWNWHIVSENSNAVMVAYKVAFFHYIFGFRVNNGRRGVIQCYFPFYFLVEFNAFCKGVEHRRHLFYSPAIFEKGPRPKRRSLHAQGLNIIMCDSKHNIVTFFDCDCRSIFNLGAKAIVAAVETLQSYIKSFRMAEEISHQIYYCRCVGLVKVRLKMQIMRVWIISCSNVVNKYVHVLANAGK